MKYQCATCGEVHDDLPDIGAEAPVYWYGLPEHERPTRGKLTSDTCIIDNRDYFIRGVIEIPLTDSTGHFGFGVWVSQAKQNFQTYLDNFDSPEIGPFFGWLSTRIDYYPVTTFNLETRAHFRGHTKRPLIELRKTDHPLSVDYHNGISLQKAWEIVHQYLK